VTGGTGIPSNSRNDILNRMLADAGRTAPPPPVPVEPKTQHPIRIKVSVLEAAKLIYSPRPDYPPLAKMARIEGTVRLEAIIGTDGRVQNLAVISGHPLLVNAALQAVSQWRYQPTLLNGEPVEVQTQIDVKFVLGD
jgi:protein TonB